MTLNRKKNEAQELTRKSVEAHNWLASILGAPLQPEDIQVALRDGVYLCRAVEKLKPETIKKFHSDVSGAPFKSIENMYVYNCCVHHLTLLLQ